MGGKTMKRKDQRWSNKGGKNWLQHKAYSSVEKANWGSFGWKTSCGHFFNKRLTRSLLDKQTTIHYAIIYA